jgi:hypothetical protein
MTLEVVRETLGWCTVINIVILWVWLLFFVFAHDWMYKLHGKWFKFSIETFDAIHYVGMATLKIGMLLFNLVPYLALRIAG